MIPVFYDGQIAVNGGYACRQEDGDGGVEWHIYANRDPDSYVKTVSEEELQEMLENPA